MTEIKVCGLTRPADARRCAELGVDVIGLNFWPGTPRCVDVDRARAILEQWPGEAVAVFVDPSAARVAEVRERTGIRWVQLHGGESPAFLASLQPFAYKAVGVGSARDVEAARRFGGADLLLDARVPGAMPGGTGHAFDWALAEAIARERRLTLAGGLSPENVAEAIGRVRPFRVDVASGVEEAPGLKSAERLEAFVAAVRAADGCSA
jgi:phosphoribosylanthranilate isomerase